MSKLKTNTIQHTGGSADNITLDNSQNVTIEGNATVDGTSTLTGNVTASGNLIANGKVGIGNDASYASGDADDLIIGTTSGSANHGLTILSPTNKNAGIYFSDGDNPNGAHRGYFDYNHTTDALNIGTAGAQKVVINSAGSISVPSGQGINFSATGDGSGSMGNELLDDYEEGTWTPIVNAGGASGQVSQPTRLGSYTKIGNTVFWNFNIYGTPTWSGSGTPSITISGLPFTVNSSDTYYHSAALWLYSGITNPTDVMIRTQVNTDYLVLQYAGSAVNTSQATGSSWNFIAHGSYRV